MNGAQAVLVGTAVGDALGLIWEGAPPEGVAADALGWPTLFGWGLVSDDTEQSVIVARAFAASEGDVERFRIELAVRLRRWFLSLPWGMGLGTARAMIRLCLGVHPSRSGSGSAGNGAAMRAGVLGVLVEDEDALDAWVDACSAVTHVEPRACAGARVVARLVWRVSRGEGRQQALERVVEGLPRGLLRDRLTAVAAGASAAELTLDRGVTGFVDDTVPAAVLAWVQGGGVREVAQRAVRLGGDTDSVAAIAGALAGAEGVEGVPSELRDPRLPARWWAEGELLWARSLSWNLALLPGVVLVAVLRRPWVAVRGRGVRPD